MKEFVSSLLSLVVLNRFYYSFFLLDSYLIVMKIILINPYLLLIYKIFELLKKLYLRLFSFIEFMPALNSVFVLVPLRQFRCSCTTITTSTVDVWVSFLHIQKRSSAYSNCLILLLTQYCEIYCSNLLVKHLVVALASSSSSVMFTLLLMKQLLLN